MARKTDPESDETKAAAKQQQAGSKRAAYKPRGSASADNPASGGPDVGRKFSSRSSDTTGYNPYAKAPKNESAAARKTREQKMYHFQRVHAEETGDQATVNKIYGKLGKKSLVGARKGDTSLNVDSDTTDKKVLGAVPLIAGARVGLRGGAKAPAQAALPRGSRAALSGGRGIPEGEVMAGSGARRAIVGARSMKNVTGTSRTALPKEASGRARGLSRAKAGTKAKSGPAKALPKPKEQLALPKPKGPSPKMQHKNVRAGSARSRQDTPRNRGENPRAKKKATA